MIFAVAELGLGFLDFVRNCEEQFGSCHFDDIHGVLDGQDSATNFDHIIQIKFLTQVDHELKTDVIK